MADVKCPGQDTRYWKTGDIFDVRCPKCGNEVEFFKDDAKRRCPCGQIIVNPKLDLACAEWCPAAEKCVEGLAGEVRPKRGRFQALAKPGRRGT